MVVIDSEFKGIFRPIMNINVWVKYPFKGPDIFVILRENCKYSKMRLRNTNVYTNIDINTDVTLSFLVDL